MPPDSEPSATEARPKRSVLAALGWGLACAACASGVWVVGFLLEDYHLPLAKAERAVELRSPLVVIAIAGSIGGLLGGLLVAFPYPVSDKTPRVLILGGTATGAIGGALALPAMILFGRWLNPLASSTLFWCFVGFLAGLGAHRLSVAAVRRAEQADKHTEEEADPGRWVLVRALPLLAVVAFLIHIILVMTTTRY